MKVIWKPIKGFENYEVSNMGKVRSLNYNKTGRVKELKRIKTIWGYLYVNLYKDGKMQQKTIHRLVAEAFINNPEGLPVINHRDENKTNNIVDNLEWCSHKYNMDYSGNTIKMIDATKKTVLQFTKNGKFLREFESTREASRQTGVNQGNISQCCNRKYKSAGGYVWRFK